MLWEWDYKLACASKNQQTTAALICRQILASGQIREYITPYPLHPQLNSPDLDQSQEWPLAKVGWTCPPQFTPWRRPCTPNTVSPRPRPTSVPSGIFIQPFGHNTPTLQTDRQTGFGPVALGRTVTVTCNGQPKTTFQCAENAVSVHASFDRKTSPSVSTEKITASKNPHLNILKSDWNR